MYTPPDFAEDDPRILHDLMRENPFALLTSNTPDGLVATHLPVVLETNGEGPTTLCGHMAKANPHWRALEANPHALIVFSGPHAYVSPSWYQAGPAVPTWNYAAVHAYGQVSLVTDQEVLDAMVGELTEIHEGDGPLAWRYDSLPDDYRARRVKGIVGFRMEIDRMEGKLKLSQNRPAGDAERVAAALEASADASARDTAAAMRRYGVIGDG